MDDDRREIFERLEALERMVRSRHHERGGSDEHRRGGRDRRDHHRHGHHRDRDGGDEAFQEKRIIDTIVRLVSEQVGRLIQDQQARSGRRDDGESEKRVVDLVVRLISEHVREIVAEELDRRMGRPREDRDDRDDHSSRAGLEPPDDRD